MIDLAIGVEYCVRLRDGRHRERYERARLVSRTAPRVGRVLFHATRPGGGEYELAVIHSDVVSTWDDYLEEQDAIEAAERSNEDVVAEARRLLDALGVKHMKSVLGGHWITVSAHDVVAVLNRIKREADRD